MIQKKSLKAIYVETCATLYKKEVLKFNTEVKHLLIQLCFALILTTSKLKFY